MPELTNWILMGGYASYVWSAYGLGVGLLLLNSLGCRLQKNKINKSLTHWFKRNSQR
jgi:heme exporter protein CcmD